MVDVQLQAEEARVSKIFTRDVKLVTGIITVTVMVMLWLTGGNAATSTAITQLQDQQKALADMLANLRDNHLHTIENKVAELVGAQQDQAKQIVEIRTILNERLPQKK